MKTQDLESYIGYLLNDPKVDPKIIEETQTVQLLLKVYCLGLQRKEFPISILHKTFDLDKETPAQFHTLVAQMAILKEGKSSPRAMEYLTINVGKLLKEFRNFFII